MDDKTNSESKGKADKKVKSDNKAKPSSKEKSDDKAKSEDRANNSEDKAKSVDRGKSEDTVKSAQDATGKPVDGQAASSDSGAKAAGAPGNDVKSPPAEAPAASPVEDATPTPGANAADVKGKPAAAASVFSDAVYTCDRQYAIVLAQLMTNNERERVYAWIERLDKMKDSDQVRDERDKYLKFLILSLSNRKLVPPFTKSPPPGLREAITVVPKSVHSLIFTDKGANVSDPPKPKESIKITYSHPDQIEPRMFFSRQPVPQNGGIVYAAAFSMQKP